MPEVLIQAENVGKKFCRDLKTSLWYGVKDSMCDLLQVSPEHRTDNLRDQEFWANSGITFQVQRGECLGLIGGNGAGKTTLLKMLSGLIKPDTGNITVKGRVGALIAIGAGFNPVLTGRENIMVYGSILGMSIQQTKDKLDQIIDFAEINDAIDSPVRTYSSGMNVRLGFSTAVNLLKPDILLLDEVLAVGDLGFRRKCYAAVDELLKNAAVIFVTHSMDHVGFLCNQVLHLNNGRGTQQSVQEGIDAYLQANRPQHTETQEKCYAPVTGIRSKTPIHYITAGETIDLELTIDSNDCLPNTIMGIAIKNEANRAACMWNSNQLGLKIPIKTGQNQVSITLGPLLLSGAEYEIELNLVKPGSIKYYISSASVGKLIVESDARRLETGTALIPHETLSVNASSPPRT